MVLSCADYRTEGQKSAKGHAPQRGFRATHVFRPCRITRRLKAPRSAAGMKAFSSCSTLTASRRAGGARASVRCRRSLTRSTWVSTGRPGSPNATLRTTLPVLRPTPGMVTRSVERGGHHAAEAIRHRARPCRSGSWSWPGRTRWSGRSPPRPRGWRRPATPRRGTPRRAHGVTMFTRASVLCADRMVAASSWNGILEVQRAQLGGGARIDLGQPLDGEAGPALRCPGLRHRFTVPGYVGRSGRSGHGGGRPAGAAPRRSGRRSSRCSSGLRAASDHPALPEPQVLAVTHRAEAPHGERLVLARQGAALVGCAMLSPTHDGSTVVHVVVDPTAAASAPALGAGPAAAGGGGGAGGLPRSTSGSCRRRRPTTSGSGRRLRPRAGPAPDARRPPAARPTW